METYKKEYKMYIPEFSFAGQFESTDIIEKMISEGKLSQNAIFL